MSIRGAASAGTVVAVAALLCAWLSDDVRAVALFLLGVLALLVAAATRDAEARTARRIALLAFVVRAAVAFADGRYAIIPELYNSDARYYDELAAAVAAAWRVGVHPRIDVSLSTITHAEIAAALYLLLGRTPVGLGVLAAMLGALSIARMHACARRLVGSHRASVIAVALALWPSHVLWTSQYFREAWVYYFAAVAMAAMLRWHASRAPRDWLTAAAGVGLLCVFRLPTGVVAAVALAAATTATLTSASGVPARLWRRHSAAASALAAGALAAIVAALAMAGDAALGVLTRAREALATGRSVLYPGWIARSWIATLGYAPAAIVAFLFAPFPWQVRNASQAGAAAENLVLLALVTLAAVRVARLRALPWTPAVFPAVFVTLGILAFALVEGNVGTAFRHKMQFVPGLLLFLAPAWPAPRSRPA